jgi:hypothetical protein
MVPFDVQTLEKFDAAIQQVEAAIELFYEKRYAPAITLAGAAEECLPRPAPGAEVVTDDDGDIQVPEPMFELMMRTAMEQFGKTRKEVITRFNAARDWLTHKTLDTPGPMELTNYDAWTMIVRAVTKIEAMRPGRETPAIGGFIEYSRKHYSATRGVRRRLIDNRSTPRRYCGSLCRVGVRSSWRRWAGYRTPTCAAGQTRGGLHTRLRLPSSRASSGWRP